eukprot:SAG31_NODE_30_length_32545_cov_9.378999_24_plen_165_part_00
MPEKRHSTAADLIAWAVFTPCVIIPHRGHVPCLVCCSSDSTVCAASNSWLFWLLMVLATADLPVLYMVTLSRLKSRISLIVAQNEKVTPYLLVWIFRNVSPRSPVTFPEGSLKGTKTPVELQCCSRKHAPHLPLCGLDLVTKLQMGSASQLFEKYGTIREILDY